MRQCPPARLVPRKSDVRFVRATMAIRPLRIAYLLPENATLEQLTESVGYATSVWGGVRSLYVPCGGSGVSEDWREQLARYDPDKVFWLAGLPEDAITDIVKRTQPFQAMALPKGVIKDHTRGYDRLGNVPMHVVAYHLHKQLRPTSDTNICVAGSHDPSGQGLCLRMHTGDASEALAGIYTDLLKGRSEHSDVDGLASYLHVLDQLSDRLTPLDMTSYELSSEAVDMFGLHLGVAIVIVSERSPVEDFCLFWGLRMGAGSFGLACCGVYALPESYLGTDNDLRCLQEWLMRRFADKTNLVTVASLGLCQGQLALIADRLRELVSEHFLVDTRHEPTCPTIRHVYRRRTEDIRVTGRIYELTLPRPDWCETAGSGAEWVTEVELHGQSEIGAPEHVIFPKFDELNLLLAGLTDAPRWRLWAFPRRLAHKQISICTSSRLEHVELELPEQEVFFERLLQSHRLAPCITEKRRYAMGMLKLLGGLHGVVALQDQGLRHLLKVMGTGHVFTVRQMRNTVKKLPNKLLENTQTVNATVRDLALKGILIRGFQFRCPECGIDEWYPCADLGERMICTGCLAELQPPPTLECSYRLNTLFARGIDQGCIPVLLTTLLLSQLCEDSFMFALGVEVEVMGGRTDVDILACCDGELIVAECKTLENLPIDADLPETTVDQVGRCVAVAESIGARIVIVSMLGDDPAAAKQDLASRLNGLSSSTELHVVCRDDLERGRLQKETAAGKAEDITLHDLVPLPPSRRDARLHISMGDKWVRMGGGVVRWSDP